MLKEGQSFCRQSIAIASYTHIVKGKITTIGGPGAALKDYLMGNVGKLLCIWQPLPISDILSVPIEFYDNGKEARFFRLPVINWPFGRKKAISLIYVLLKIRDVFSVFFSFALVRQRFDTFIGVEAVNALTGVFLRKVGLVKKVVYYNLDYGINRLPVKLFNYMFHLLDKLAVENSDFTWSLSEQMLIERKKRGIVNKKHNNQLVAPIGINFYKVKRLPIEQIDRKRVVYLGTLMRQQGVQLLIEAFSDVVKKIPNASLLIIGSGEFEPQLKQMVGEYELDEHVKFTGIISDEEAEEFLCKSLVAVAPYIDDPYSNKRFTEPTKPKTYLACGLPVIITKVPKIAFEIHDAKAGIAINYNKEELKEALIRFLCDDSLYREYRQNAINFASKYDWKNIFDNVFAASCGNIKTC